MQGAITGRRHGSAQAERRAKAKLALVAAAAAALLAQGYPTPNWTPIYNMSESTIVQPCNYSGLYNPDNPHPEVLKFGLVSTVLLAVDRSKVHRFFTCRLLLPGCWLLTGCPPEQCTLPPPAARSGGLRLVKRQARLGQ
jgi:hypothetical protein